MLHHRLNCSHIYYVYVYKSLRRPHIPEACKERGGRERQEAGRDDATEAGDRRCVKSGQEVDTLSTGSLLALLYLQPGAKPIYYCCFGFFFVEGV